MPNQLRSIYDRITKAHRSLRLVDLEDGSYASAVMSPPGRNVDVLIGDQSTNPFDVFMGIIAKDDILLTSDAAIGDRVISVAAGHGFTAGDYIAMSKPGRIYTGHAVVVSTNDITLDTLVHDSFLASETIILRGTHNLNVAGTPGTPAVAKIVLPQYPGSIDITRIMIQMTCATDPAWDTYGDVASLLYGTQLRVVYNAGLETEVIVPVWNIKDNSEYAIHAFDVDFYLAAGPQAVSGLAIRSTFAGQSKRGVVIRLTSADELQLLIQDDLSTLLTHYYMAEGHIVLP